MTLEVTVIDAFTDKPFSGNPAAVCILPSPLSESKMRLIAAEMNLSETAFLSPEGDGFRLRWFTPTSEVSLCGHATLASAHALWTKGGVTDDEILFHTLSGTLTATREEGAITLDFPAEEVISYPLSDLLRTAVSGKILFEGKTSVRHFVELSSAEEVRNLAPDLSLINRCAPGRIIVTARSDDPRYDFISRYFAPGIGVPEDPVTGSAHCALACYWAQKLGKNEFNAYQASRRGGALRVKLAGERVFLTGHAVTMFEGRFVSTGVV